MTLYEIDNEIRLFIDRMMDAVDENGELVEVDPTQLEALQAERDAKWESIACYYKNLIADAAAIEAEEKNLKARREAMTNKAERLKGLLTASMQNAQKDKFDTARCAISFRTSTQVIIPDEDKLDAMYMRAKTEYKPDKKLIKENIKAGIKVGGAYLQDVKNIQIK